MTLTVPADQAPNGRDERDASARLESRDIQAFARELDELFERCKRDLGQRDVDFIDRCFDLCHKSEVAGRVLIHLSLDPFTWLLGSTLLAYHMGSRESLMHIIHHGAYDDIPNAPSRFHSQKTPYKGVIGASVWKFHPRHHANTNHPAMDTDYGHGFSRWSGGDAWYPHHLFQLPLMALSTIAPVGGLLFIYPFFQSGLMEFFFPKRIMSSCLFHEKHDWEAFRTSVAWFMEGVGPYLAKNFVFYPALAGLFWPKVLLGNLFAHYLAGAVSWLHALSPHIGQPTYAEKPGGRAEWYVQQVEGTANLRMKSEYMKIFSAGNHQQIEHHLCAKLPVNRLWEVAPEVEAICKKYGIRYETDTWMERTKRVLRTLGKYSFPVH
jgi:linoleoyl-CoA desaturase